MIISASRRTDIPAFYPNWFINRIRAGYCTVPNPFNRKQISYISLLPEDVQTIVFWTRNPRPLFDGLAELDDRGFPYYFQFTLVNNPRAFDPYSPPLEKALQTFADLARRVGPARVIWRYDPIVISNITPPDFHAENYARIAQALKGYTKRSVVSIVDQYRKFNKRIKELKHSGIYMNYSIDDTVLNGFVPELVQTAQDNGMQIVSCAENIDLLHYGIKPGKCIDDDLISKELKVNVAGRKDPSQRKECGCVISRDIGMYDSCLFGCRYCYATRSFKLSRRQFRDHNPESPSLIGEYDTEPPSGSNKGGGKNQLAGKQLKIF